MMFFKYVEISRTYQNSKSIVKTCKQLVVATVKLSKWWLMSTSLTFCTQTKNMVRLSLSPWKRGNDRNNGTTTNFVDRIYPIEPEKRIPQIQICLLPILTYTSKSTVGGGEETNFTTKGMISSFLLWTTCAECWELSHNRAERQSHEWGEDPEVCTTSGTHPWSFVTQIFHIIYQHWGQYKIEPCLNSKIEALYAIY
jgi:hypothetical protein